MTGAGVLTEDLSKFFGPLRAVDGLTIAVAPGEIYGLLGPNGAGKTTALRMLAGLVAPTRGRALVAGLDVASDPDHAKAALGFLSASTGLYGRLDARELLAYFAGLYGLEDETTARRIAHLAGALGIEPLLGRRCETLSSGEKQRVSLARAMIHDPAVLVLDEPTSGLDVLGSRFLRDFVRTERARGKAVIFSTHYLAEAELMCDRIGLIHRGRLLREGSPAALRTETGAATLEEVFLTLVGMAEGERGAAPAPAA